MRKIIFSLLTVVSVSAFVACSSDETPNDEGLKSKLIEFEKTI